MTNAVATALPLNKTPQTLDAARSKVLLYGPPKIGKSTLCARLDPEHTLFLVCEPGLGGLEVFQYPVNSWDDFRAAYEQLANNEHNFKTVVVDTVDELYRMCQESVMRELGVNHPSDLEWGKGWSAVGDKWRLAVGALAKLGLGVWFISHARDEQIKQRVGQITKTVPMIGGKAREFLLGFCDHIFLVTQEVDAEGTEARVVRTSPSEFWEAGSRLPAVSAKGVLPLDAQAVVAALNGEA